MRYLAVFLSMPNVGSWNGRWTGEDKPYVSLLIAPERNKQQLAERLSLIGYYHYDFGDGWSVGITIKEVDVTEYKRLKKVTAGFAGYSWMINSIIKHKRIVGPNDEVFFKFNDRLVEFGFEPTVTDKYDVYLLLECTLSDTHKIELRCYNQYNKHADEHMILYVNGKYYMPIIDTTDFNDVVANLRGMYQ